MWKWVLLILIAFLMIHVSFHYSTIVFSILGILRIISPYFKLKRVEMLSETFILFFLWFGVIYAIVEDTIKSFL